MKEISDLLKNMQSVVPVEWSRYTEKDGDYNIYGWIKRNDGQRDFIVLQLHTLNGMIKGDFVTSSAKYSKVIYEFLYNKTDGHNECKKIETLCPSKRKRKGKRASNTLTI